ncbi:histidine kinase [Fischerella muscicola CCMEE 5323]|uniref:histidine kinase n=1 Tax=Fischerella muscicola CCMEE 5323 TaxID=2019572 RepID=A0A2N6K7Y8_FISMU|nr:HAMP domain-containing sensor histidine kinase [Fischerella muscicola]PLZ93262.1 histidine kinase [Fischerella muscicola CCMEE 5323]
MNLRKKLLTIFSGLALLALASGGVTVWAIAAWHASEDNLQDHYQRSLLLQQVRAATFRALKEVPDRVITDDDDAEEEFEESLEPVEEDFQRWAKLADNEAERQQLQEVRDTYNQLIQNARVVFNLMEAGRQDEAFRFMEEQLEEEDFEEFQEVTEEAVASDQKIRQRIRQQTRNTRQTAQLVLMISAFGIVSLILLLFAYLNSDLFAPLREAEQALDDVARGNFKRRLDEERKDELGMLNRAFNRMTSAIAQREQVMGLMATTSQGTDNSTDTDWRNLPSRLTLHTLVSQLRSRVSQLYSSATDNNVNVAVEQKQELIPQLDQLLQAISRVTEFGFPLDLNLARTDIRALLYEVLLRFHDEFVRRSVSFELQVAPEVTHAVVDRLKLREALGELIRNSLSALPEVGGSLGVRSSLTTGANDATELLIEVADDGAGSEQPLINQAFLTFDDSSKQRPSVGLKLTKAIVEEHGGSLTINSKPGLGTHIQIRLPLREE